MLRGQDHVHRAEERIRARGENAHLLARHGQGKIHFRADTAANPVALLHLHLVDEVHRVQAVEQLLGIGGNLQHPLLLDLADDLRAAALAHAAHNFLIRQTALAAGAPVNRHFGLIRQPVLEQLKENPLRPAVVGRIGGVDLAGIVEGEADFLQLLAEVVDVLLRYDGGVNLVLDGVVLRRQTEGVPADGEKDIAALHAALAGDPSRYWSADGRRAAPVPTDTGTQSGRRISAWCSRSSPRKRDCPPSASATSARWLWGHRV